MFDADQTQVVNHGEGPMLVVAGAGSGKTTAVVGRAVRLIQAGLPPSAHLMLTFTRKAAEEMRHRIAGQLEDIAPSELQVHTFHSFCWKVIRRTPGLFGCIPGVTLLLEDDIDRIFKGLAKSLGYLNAPDALTRKKQAKLVGRIQGLYSTLRNEGGALDDLASVESLLVRYETNDVLLEMFTGLCGAYEAYKTRTNTLDFDDLIGLMVRGLTRDTALREKLQRQYPYLTVDEAQDTNLPQFQLVELLAGPARNVVMVGDDDQAIYAWRGARPQNLRDFEHKFGARIAFLMNNYRSQQRIVEAAGEHISYNFARFDKTPKPIREPMGKLNCWYWEHGSAAAKALAQKVAQELKSGTPAGQIAVLYRTNRAAHLLRRAFAAQRIPHHIVNGFEFIEQAEVQMALAAARLASNPRDVAAFIRLCELVDGVGDKAIENMTATAKLREIPIFDAMAETKLSAKAQDGLARLQARIRHLTSAGPLALLDTLLAMGIQSHFSAKDKDHEQTRRRLDALKSLQDMITEWLGPEASASLVVRDPQSQWQEIFDALLLDTKHNDLPENHVWLSTVHQAKGLEWTCVHIWGMSDGVFPLGNADEEEERRLSYVAITRAKDACHLWHAETYPDREGQEFSRSRFIRELPKHHLEVVEASYA